MHINSFERLRQLKIATAEYRNQVRATKDEVALKEVTLQEYNELNELEKTIINDIGEILSKIDATVDRLKYLS